MSTSSMTTQSPKLAFEEVHLDDPALEEELFGTYEPGSMDPALEEELFGSVEESDSNTTTTSSSNSPKSSDNTATSPSSTGSSVAPDMNDEALLAKHAQQCFGEGAVIGMTEPGKLTKTAVMLEMEEEKRVRLERRAMVLKKGLAPVADRAAMGAPKRKRGDDDENVGKETKRPLTDVDAAEIQKQPPTLAINGVQERKLAVAKGVKRGQTDASAGIEKQPQMPAKTSVHKRKRGGVDEDEEKGAKRGLTDAVAVEISQQREHVFVDDLKKMEEGRDSVTGAGVESAGIDGTETVQKDGETEEQHLAPPATAQSNKSASNDLTITEDDDEMTRMLKEELAKPFDEDDEPEDPRVEEIMQPLTEPEKLYIANLLAAKERSGGPRAELKSIEKAVGICLVAREKAKKTAEKRMRAVHAPKQTSPLTNDGVNAEQLKIEGRAKLPVKSRKAVAKGVKNTPVTTDPTPAAVPSSAEDTTTAPSRSTSPAPTTSDTTATSTPTQPESYATLTIPDLKDLCRDRGLVVGGNKNAILKRLEDYDVDNAAGRVPKGLKPVAKPKKYVYPWMK